MKKIVLIMTIIAAIVSSTGCRKKIDLELNNDKFSRLVVEGTITDENINQVIHLSKTSDYSHPQGPVPAEGATVTVSDGTNTYSFSETTPGIYKSDAVWKGEVGKTYTLHVVFDNKEYTASQTMQPAFQIDSLYAWPSSETGVFALYINASEPATPNQYYLIKTLRNGIENDSLKNWSYFSDELLNGMYLQDLGVGYLYAKTGDTLQMKSFSISKEHYDFLINAMTQTQSAPIPFIGGSPGNIVGNISNGAMGFFQVSSVSVKSCIAP